MRISMKIMKAVPLLAILVFGMSVLPSNNDVFGFVEYATVETTKTIPTETAGVHQHFIKICAGENDRLERPNIIISSDLESFREQVYVNLPPNFCTHQNYKINAENPNSITVQIIESTNF